jgi:hypothetical protein
MSGPKRTPEEVESDRIARREQTLANQRKIIAYVRRVKETSQNDIRVHVGSVDGLKELIAANVLVRDQYFTITLAP